MTFTSADLPRLRAQLLVVSKDRREGRGDYDRLTAILDGLRAAIAEAEGRA